MESLSNLTPRAQQTLAFARLEADRFHHNFVGTEHLLLGLIRLGQGVAVTVLVKEGLTLDAVRLEVEKHAETLAPRALDNSMPYTPRLKKVLRLAAEEAKALNHTYVGTEHILLGLLREGEGVAGRVLKDFGIDVERTRLEILQELDPKAKLPATGTESSSFFIPLGNQTAATSQSKGSPQHEINSVDITKRYDLYCAEMGSRIVVYRNVRFKGVRGLMSAEKFDVMGRYYEIEQPNAQCVFISKHSLIKFCEHGVEPIFEVVVQK